MSAKMRKGFCFMLAFAMLVTSACTTTPGNAEMPMCPEQEIRKDWASRDPSLTPENVRIDRYFGTYNGKVALMISGDGDGFPDMVWEQIVAGVVFHYNSGQQIHIWYNRDFFSLPQAYEQGFLTAEDIMNVNYRHRQAFPFMYNNEYDDE